MQSNVNRSFSFCIAKCFNSCITWRFLKWFHWRCKFCTEKKNTEADNPCPDVKPKSVRSGGFGYVPTTKTKKTKLSKTSADLNQSRSSSPREKKPRKFADNQQRKCVYCLGHLFSCSNRFHFVTVTSLTWHLGALYNLCQVRSVDQDILYLLWSVCILTKLYTLMYQRHFLFLVFFCPINPTVRAANRMRLLQ